MAASLRAMVKKKTPQEIAADAKYTASGGMDVRQPQTWNYGDKSYTNKAEYDAARSAAGIVSAGGGVITPDVASNSKVLAKEAEINPPVVSPDLLNSIAGNLYTLPDELGGKQTNPDLTLGSTIKGILPETAAGILAKAGAGAAAGGIATGGVGAIAGAVGGAVWGIGTIIPNLKAEEKQKTKVAYKDYTTTKTNMKAIIDYARKGGDPIDAINLYKAEWAKIYKAEMDLKQLEERDWLSKAKDELTAVQNFKESKVVYDTMMQNAILQNPNANYEFPTDEVVTEND